MDKQDTVYGFIQAYTTVTHQAECIPQPFVCNLPGVQQSSSTCSAKQAGNTG